jgi:lysophospholipase L1-like esterase
MTRAFLILMAGGLLLGKPACAQLVDEFNAPPANCCLVDSARLLADQLQDWNQVGRYHAANQELTKRGPQAGRVVFMGDSITDLWPLEDYFPGRQYVNRGISGQVTSQMLVRMYPDVIALHPAAVVFLGGTNDISRNTGPSTAEMIEQSIMSMVELAQHHGIKVVLCSVLPVSDYPFLTAQTAAAGRGGARRAAPRRMTITRPPGDILKINAWLKDYARQINAIYADYFSAVVDDKGFLKDGTSDDGLHPNANGYKLMAPVVSAAIQQALR